MLAAANRVLFVEDDCLLHDWVGDALATAGFEPVIATTADEACLILTERRDELCALVTDVNLGGVLTGWDVAKLARAIRADMPVVYASGGNEQEFRACGVAGGVLVPKPYEAHQIATTVVSLMENKAKLARLGPGPDPHLGL